ncbi:MAG: glucose-1-phosphate adenylyltransferase [Actinobacteria bacterium]|nr:glucose-1-phosphate adenylyltransferase [Actinomycetota bacterium]
MAELRVLGIVLAGGAGRRLGPLTADRAKSAVPFGGLYRLVDFALSNLVNGGIFRIWVLTQYKSHSLDRHIITTWQLNNLLGNYVMPVPAQQRLGPYWQAGSADAIHQSLNLIYRDRPDVVAVFGADHVYRMDPRQLIEAHRAWGAGVTIAAIPVPRMQATDFGVVQTAADGHRIEAFLEKPADPPGLPGSPDEAFVSMGNYVFDTDVLVDALRKDAANDDTGHSMGGDVVPMLVTDGAAHVYDFTQNAVPGAEARDVGYWREVGTIDSYFDAHMDLCAVHPVFNLYNDRWPILTHVPPQPPAKFVHSDGDRTGRAVDSVISNGVIISGGLARNSVLSPGARVDSWAQVNRSVLLHNSRVGRHAAVRNAILDKNVVVTEGATVGVDAEHDRARGFVVSDGGITVVGKGQVVTPLPAADRSGRNGWQVRRMPLIR